MGNKPSLPWPFSVFISPAKADEGRTMVWNTMKKIVILGLCLTILLMITPSGVAYAASKRQTSKSFVVRNWKGEVEPPDDELPPTEELPPEDDDVVDEPDAPVVDEPEEQGEQGEELLADDESLPADEEQAIPSVNEDADGQGEEDEPDADETPSPEPITDQVEQSEEPAAVETPADDGEEEITTEEEPEKVGEARVVIGGAEEDGEPSD